MIRIKSQDAIHQYDEEGRAITTWDSKKCSWIVNPEYENEQIDWWGDDNDFPAGETNAEFTKRNPKWDNNAVISVTWFWNTKEKCIRTFGQPSSFLPKGDPHIRDYWDIQTYPYTSTKQWEYLAYTEEEAIEHLGKYCGFNKTADKTIVRYNDKIIFEGKLE